MYLEYAYGKVENRNHITDNIQVHLDRAIKERKPMFRSLYLYDEEMLEHVSVNKTTEGFRGTLYPDNFWIDIDEGKEGRTVGEQAKLMYEKLLSQKIPEAAIQVCFSGRGFHIYIKKEIFDLRPSTILHKVYYKLAQKLGMECDSSIYTPLRLVRLNNTVNEKSGLYKIPLFGAEVKLMDMDDIYDAARNTREKYLMEFEHKGSVVIGTGELYAVMATDEEKKHIARKEDANISNRTINTCLHNMIDSEPVEGQRHHTILTASSLMWRQGTPLSVAQSGLSAWVGPGMGTTETDRLVADAYRRGYTPACTGDNFMSQIMQKHCDKQCKFYTHKDSGVIVLSPEDIERDYYENRNKMVLLDIGKFMQEPDADAKFNAGGLMSVLGAPGRGKTAYVQNMLLTEKTNMLYISLEMDAGTMFRRFCQIAHGLDKHQINKMVDDGYIIDRSPWDHISMVTMTLDLEQISKVVNEYMPRIVIIDHLKLLKKEGRDLYLTLAKYTNEFKQMAMRLKMGFIVISQVTREVASGKLKISMTSGSGTSSIEEDSDILMTIDGEEDSNLRVVKINKARDCDTIKASYKQEGKTFRFTKLNQRVASGSAAEFQIFD